MKQYLFYSIFCLTLINQTVFGAGLEDTRYKRSSSTPKGHAVHSGCESGQFDNALAEVGGADEQPEEEVAMVEETYREPVSQNDPASPYVESYREMPRSTPTYKTIPMTVSARPCEPACVEPVCSPCPPCQPCDPGPAYSSGSWTRYVLPVAIAGSALAVSAVRATDSCDDPCPNVTTPILEFFVEASLGGFDGESNAPGLISVEILFPDSSALDTITLSTTSTPVPVIQSQLSNATRNYSSGDQFTVNVTALSDRVNSITVEGRLDGVAFDSHPQVSPTLGPLFTFTIP